MNKKQLSERWLKFGNFTKLLAATNNLSRSPFGESESGRQDFRGIRLSTEAFPTGGGFSNESHEIDLINCDFSFLKLEGFDFKNSKILNCLFSDSVLTGDIRFFNVEIDGCNFDGCTFKDVNFTSSILKNTSFSGWKKSSKCSFNSKLIEGCQFSGEIKGVDFSDSPIKKSIFKGSVAGCNFLGVYDLQFEDSARTMVKIINSDDVINRMDGVDFSDTILIECTFRNFCYLDLIKPPKIKYSCIVRITSDFCENLKINVANNISADVSKKAALLIDSFYKADPRTLFGVMGFEDFVKYLGKSENDVFYKTFCDTAIQTNAIVK